MKKILIFLLILSNLTFGAQKMSLDSKEIDKILEQVSKDFDRGNSQKAISTLKKKIAEDPSKIIYKVILGFAYEEMGRKSEAEKEFNEAVELQKKYPFFAENGEKYDVRLLIGVIYFSENYYDETLKWLKQVDDKEFYKSTDEEKGIFLGIVNFQAENYEEAKKYLLQSYAYDKIGASENVLGMIYWGEGNQKEAQKWFLKSSDKGNSGAQANLGSLYYELNDKKESLKWLEKAYETARKDKDTEKMEEIKEMIKDVKDSQEKKQKGENMKKYLILLLLVANLGLGIQGFSAMTREEKISLEKQIDEAYDKNDNKKTISLVSRYVKEFPNNADYLNKLGVLYANENNYKEAEKWYLKAIENGNLTAISNLADNYSQLKDYEKAIKYYKEYEKVADNPRNYTWIAAAYENLEDYKNAREWYFKALKTEKDGFSENHLGLMADNEGNQKEALKWYQASAQKGYLWGYSNLATTYIELGDYETAEKWVIKGLDLAKKSKDSDVAAVKKEMQDTYDYIQKVK